MSLILLNIGFAEASAWAVRPAKIRWDEGWQLICPTNAFRFRPLSRMATIRKCWIRRVLIHGSEDAPAREKERG